MPALCFLFAKNIFCIDNQLFIDILRKNKKMDTEHNEKKTIFAASIERRMSQ